MGLAVVRDMREARVPASPEELTAFETDVLAGFVLARAAAGLSDRTISLDVALPVRPDGRSQHLFNPAGTSCASGPQPFRAASRLLRRPQPAHDVDLVLPRTPTAAGSPS